MKVLVIGKGKMANCLKKLYPNEIIDMIDQTEDILSFNKDIDGVIDFSHHSLLNSVLTMCVKNKYPLVIGTTDLDNENLLEVDNAKKSIPICLDSNYSLGILSMKRCIESLSSFTFKRIVVSETHHVSKKDTPSGTALSLKKFLNKMFSNEIIIKSYREGEVNGIHKIDFINDNESISIRHEAYNRDIFAEGAMTALTILKNRRAKLYNFEEIING